MIKYCIIKQLQNFIDSVSYIDVFIHLYDYLIEMCVHCLIITGDKQIFPAPSFVLRVDYHCKVYYRIVYRDRIVIQGECVHITVLSHILQFPPLPSIGQPRGLLRSNFTCQLCDDSLERQLSEFLYERLEQSAVDQLVSSLVQLVDRDEPVGQNPFHLHPVPTRRRNQLHR